MSAEMVFISYSSKNADLANAMVAYLEKKGITCWYAPRNIEPGSEWVPAIKSALQAAKVFVLLYTHQSNESRQVMNEVALAFNAGKTMVPYCATDEKMNDELEYYLTRVHWLNAVNKPQEECFEELSKLIEGNLHRMNVEIHPVEAQAPQEVEPAQEVTMVPEAEIVRETEVTPEAEMPRENWTAPETEPVPAAESPRENWTASEPQVTPSAGIATETEAGLVTEAAATPETEIVQEAVTEEAENVRENWAVPETEVTPAAEIVEEAVTTPAAENPRENWTAPETAPAEPSVAEAPKASSGYVAGQEAEAAARAIKAMREAQRKEAMAKAALKDEYDDEESGRRGLNDKTKKILLWGGAAAAFVVLLLLGILLGTKLAKSGKDNPEGERVESEDSREGADSGEKTEYGTPKDESEAWEESVAALSAGDKKELGYQYLNGHGVEQDVELGRKLLKQAGEEGDYEAKVAYAKDLLTGESGGAINEEEAIRIMKQIIDGGTKDPNVMIALADYYDGTNNYKDALRYYQFASDYSQDEQLCLKLAEYYLEGKGTKKNAYLAQDWISRSKGQQFYQDGGYADYSQMAYYCIYGYLNVSANLKYDIVLEAAGEGDSTATEWLVQRYFTEKGLMRNWESVDGSEIVLDDNGGFVYDHFTSSSTYLGTYDLKPSRVILSFDNGTTWTGVFYFSGGERYMDVTINGNLYRFTDVTERLFSLD
ncbi:MAG: TIR domain-containing protein [Lachnospiraceae bacterium]|nr:TIR domain-containing protein [Lachnospiraceae bacterium]